MIDGIMYLLSFVSGAVIAFALANHYNNKLLDMMREVMAVRRRRKPEEEEQQN